jgi:hypothetical protein
LSLQSANKDGFSQRFVLKKHEISIDPSVEDDTLEQLFTNTTHPQRRRTERRDGKATWRA